MTKCGAKCMSKCATKYKHRTRRMLGLHAGQKRWPPYRRLGEFTSTSYPRRTVPGAEL